MVERRTEFPALEARRWFLEHEYHFAQRQADDAVRGGRADSGTQQWIMDLRAELDELNYILRMVGDQDHRIEITQRTLMALALLYGIIMATIVVLFLRYYGA